MGIANVRSIPRVRFPNDNYLGVVGAVRSAVAPCRHQAQSQTAQRDHRKHPFHADDARQLNPGREQRRVGQDALRGALGGFGAFCVRTCDGRYFPLASPTGQSRTASCNELCPASDTKVFYGSNIDHAASENGKSYASMPNAFRYRDEIVSGCTCNGKDTFGLAKIDIKDDPTLRKGDIVAGEDGLMVAHKADKRGASLNFSPASPAIVARYARAPIMASE